MKLRLFLRDGSSDYNGVFVGWHYKSVVVDVSDDTYINMFQGNPIYPEVIGGEWLRGEDK